jgi:cytochrome c-type biogenesis protein CcmH
LNSTRRKLLLAFLLLAAPFGLAADRQQIIQVSNNLVCMCGCHQLLGICNMLSCPTRSSMQEEVGKMLDEGRTQEQILPAFADKYGLRVLAAPPASGFNLSAWIMPFLALAAGIVAVLYVARQWKARWPAPSEAQPAASSKYDKRIEEELEKYTPED